MSKINATYSSGYYIAPDVDFRKLEEQQRQEKRGKRQHGAQPADGGDENVKRQTFAIPFDIICGSCHRRIARGSHVYANRRATEKRYLDSIRIWELEILCRFCQAKYYLLTDPETPKETGGYVCAKGCKRVEGDFYALNKQNQEAREEWEKAKAEAELNPLAALEKENEAARALEERNRQIEQAVEERSSYDDGGLLSMLRHRPRRGERRADAADDGSEEDEDKRAKDKEEARTVAVEPMGGAPPSPLFALPSPSPLSADDNAGNGQSGEDEDVEERAYREFSEDMERRWRTLERQQRAQQRQQEQQSAASDASRSANAHAVAKILKRYGGDRRINEDLQQQPPAAITASSSTGVSLPPDFTSPPFHNVPSPKVKYNVEITRATNKFFVADDDDDADVDIEHAPLSTSVRALPASRTTLVTNSPAPAKNVTSSSTHLCPNASVKQPGKLRPPKPVSDGSSLLRRLMDEDDSD